ncbi:hypothetical protein QYE76_037595 [Lolium multiflorum]|uniref:Uncharacterized protein n=1 Tax=Lolium multiflorum TaxID=4521 RepID=A0AAD8VE36_LOLMU|nr:hypothetical protein QYE76_037595 [Lolium multiflorum]
MLPDAQRVETPPRRMAAGCPWCAGLGCRQYTNCKYACEVWGVGLRLDDGVRQEQVMAGHVRQAMESKEMRRNAAGWKAKAKDAQLPVNLRIRTCRAW